MEFTLEKKSFKENRNNIQLTASILKQNINCLHKLLVVRAFQLIMLKVLNKYVEKYLQLQKTRINFLLLTFIFSQIAKKNLNKIHGLQEIHLHQNYDLIFIMYSLNYSSLKSQRKNSLTIKNM
jgi:hypothetical protein